MARPNTAAVRLLAGDREPVLVATTANISLSGLQTIDSIVVVAGDRVLVKNQTDATENGIYEASTGTWYRAADARSSRAINKGVTVHVQSGTANAGNVYAFQTLDPDLGEDNIVIALYLTDDFAADALSLTTAYLLQISEAGSSILGSVANPVFASKAAAEAYDPSPDPIPGYIRLEGYHSVGDGGGALYKHAVSEPSHEAKFQTADAEWWELADRVNINVKQLGARGNGSNNDLQAIQDAHDALATQGGVLYFPASTSGYLVEGGSIEITKDNTVIRGDGHKVSFINLGSDGMTFDVFVVDCFEQIVFEDLGILNFGDVPDGTPVYGVNSTAINTKIRRCWFQDLWSGILLGAPLGEVSNTWIRCKKAAAGICVELSASGDMSCDIFDCWFQSTSGGSQIKAGVYAQGGGTIVIRDTEIQGCGTAYWVKPPLGIPELSLICEGVWFDTSASNGLVLDGRDSLISRVRIDACWACSAGASGILIQGDVYGVSITDGEIFGNGGHGIQVEDDAVVKGLLIESNKISGNIGTGILIGANVSEFIITGNAIGPYADGAGNGGHGVFVAAGASDKYIISKNLVLGNTSGQVTDSGTGVVKDVSKNPT